MKPLHGQEAYVLHARPYRETSVLVTCFVANLGKMNLLARGVRTARSPLKALLQPFMPLMISFQGRTDLKLLTQCELYGEWSPLKGSSLACGLYLNELLYALLPNGIEHARLFDCYQHTLMAMSRGEAQGAVLRLFEKHLLDELGYALQLTHDVDGAPIEPMLRYSYLPKSGARPLLHEAARGIAGKTLLDLERDDLSDPVSALEAQHLLRPMIEHLLEGKPIQSRAIWV
ncbi:MAG: DNA repair protein RecO [Gammaproteobacteria bacterium]